MIDFNGLEKRFRAIEETEIGPKLLEAYASELLLFLGPEVCYVIQEREEWTATVLYATRPDRGSAHVNPAQFNDLTGTNSFFFELNFVPRRSLKALLGDYLSVAGLRISNYTFKGWIVVGWPKLPIFSREEIENVLYRFGDKVLICTLSFQQIALDQQYRFLFGVVPQAVVLLNEAEDINWINQSALDLLNLEAGNLRPSSASLAAGMLQLRNRALNQDAINQTASELINNPAFVTKEWIWTFSEKVLSVFTKPIFSPYFKGRIWLFNDVTELYRKHQQLSDANQEIENLISVIAHDLKSPLSTISFVFSFLPMIGLLNDEQNESIEHGQKTIKRGLHLIDSIVGFNSLATQTLVMEDIELDFLIDTVVDSFSAQAYQKEISLHIERTHPPLILHSDPKSLVRILDNLISNALKFSPFGQRVHIHTELINHQLRLAIKDEGPGISPDDQAKLFKRFQRLSAQPTNNEGSSGLGLSIVKSLTEKLGASIEVESSMHVGTTFRVVFPAEFVRLGHQNKVEQEFP
ncbi:sensor histidine kinase [Spirosoma endophyticum]|uniref:histidine kinase n=1 Tax=Spirosoma endophyticum TaxID=662367 RepID=A0A1I2H3Q9_9BACT|nr:HAMP domain-containing sensor histidine kinase [Spirosoma endophyticum]SFF24033.1 Histidine kinase-, DNA gyrase B-, and HSP90-like ATPase [Spirosoma endophyticum]